MAFFISSFIFSSKKAFQINSVKMLFHACGFSNHTPNFFPSHTNIRTSKPL